MELKDKLRLVQELVPGKQITIAQIIANPDEIIDRKLGLDPAVDYIRAAIGIVTHIHDEKGAPARAERWLRLAGCTTVFHVDSTTGEGVRDILNYLREPNDPPIK